MSLLSSCLVAGSLLAARASAFTGSEYRLSHEYSGLNFFDGWDFYSGRDPTGGFVTYYSRSSAQLTDLIRTTEDGPAYMGVNYVDKLPFDNATGRGNGAGRPSVRIASKQAFTHGLFIGDFQHIPAGICGTWPAFWTLGPNWPYTGEVDILEGVNANTNNVMSLHTNETCTITGNATVMTGNLENTNCAYYPDYNVGCGVSDPRPTSFGVGFNNAGGGVYAMQWTSESILIWHWARADVPEDVDSKVPDPGSWGLPVAQLAVGNCSVDQHFQSHKIIFDTTFCGEYAGNPFVWKNNDENSCADSTGLTTCDNYVANYPAIFEEAYWSVNYVRVYELIDPSDDQPTRSYIASEQPANTATNIYTAPPTVATSDLDVDSLCPQYNFSIITDGKYQYEIACDFDPPGPDLIGVPYQGFTATSMADCIAGCTYLNDNNGTNTCGAVSHLASINFCYFKKYIDGTPTYRKGYNEIRLIYYGYPQITDDPRSTADSTLTSVFVETIPTPQTYRPLTTTTRVTASSTTGTTTPRETSTPPPALGDNSTSVPTTSGVGTDYSETVTISYGNATSTTSGPPTSVTSTDPEVTNDDFYIIFKVDITTKRLSKRAVKYLTFDGEGQSVLVDSEAEAAKFRLGSDGALMSGMEYVVIDTSVSPPRFMLRDEVPADPVTVNVGDDGNVSVPGVDDYCVTSTGVLAVLSDGSEAPVGCVIVEPELISTPEDTTSSITQTSTVSSTSAGITSATTTTSPVAPTPGSTISTTTDAPTAAPSVSDTNSFSTNSSTGSSSASSRSTSSGSSSGLGSLTTSRSSTTASTPPTASTINSFVYAGCFGIPTDRSPASLPGISIAANSDSMTNEKCTAACLALGTAYYAATHDINCFCSTDVTLYALLLDFPDASCNTPCPGANREFCGGTVLFDDALPTTAAKIRRQQGDLILVSLYNNTLLLGGGGTDTATDSITTTAIPPMTTSLYFDPDSVSYNVTGTSTATIISTTYVDVCPPDGPTPGALVTHSTTITAPHCGCTASYDADLQAIVHVPSPAVPMITTTKTCACGHAGAQSQVTVTVPNTSSIQYLAAMVTSTILGPGAGDVIPPMPAATPANLAPAAKPGAESPAPVVGNQVIPVGNAVAAASVGASADFGAVVDAVSDFKTTPTGNNQVTPAAAQTGSPAPASPPSLNGQPAAPAGNASAPRGTALVGNSTLSAPIASYSANMGSRSRMIGVSSEMQSWKENWYALELIVGLFCTSAMVWL